MSDRDIIAAFFPEQRPDKPASSSTGDMRKLFWSLGQARGMSERQIQAEWSKQFKGK